MTREEMDRVLARHFQAEAANDLDGVLSTLTDDAEHDTVGDPTPVLRGHAAIKDRYMRVFADFAEERFEPVRRYHGPDFVVDECVFTARAVGEPFGVPGDGREVSFRLLHVCEFRDGKISRENVWMDTAAALAQLGALPAGA
ncbi:nuclear transport factor 2 family protein [Actinomadura sp. 9N215]|uniref:nuclear transport factor 2 family protein n=1 Tax=Actinomadura sp. 9N215 TaxID=3375150 RepID=UPI0037B2C388